MRTTIKQMAAKRGWLVVAGGMLSIPALAGAAELFNSSVSFSTQGQSMWGSGNAFIFDYRKPFLSPSFSTGSLFVNPGPISANGVTVDPRFAFSATGQMGVEAGLYMNSGSVDANLGYDVSISAPNQIKAGDFFKFNGSSALNGASTLVSTSPTVETYLDGILKISVNDFYEAKVSGGSVFNGVSNGTFTHQRDAGHGGPRVNVDVREQLFGFNSGGSGRLVWKASDVGGVGDVVKVGNPLAPTAEFTLGDWRIDASGGVVGNGVSASGQTTLLTTLIDVDAGLVGPVLGPSVNVDLGPNVSVSAGYDVVDFDITMGVGYQQSFDLTSSMSMVLHFSEDVLVKDANGNVTTTNAVSASAFDQLPEIALIGTSVDVTPEFFVSADLHNLTDVQLDLLMQYKAIAGHISLDFDSTFYSDNIYSANFGPLESWNSDIDPLTIGVYDQAFALGGFTSFTGASFSLAAVPLPPALWLFTAGVFGLAGVGRRRGRRRPAHAV